MDSNSFLNQSVHSLGDSKTARLDVLVLLEDATGHDRGWLLAHPEFELDAVTIKKLTAQIERRAGHEPLSYIRGKSEFYGREFLVTPDTLQPRTETETIIDLLKNLILEKPVIIADIGTGSGCLAITAKLEFKLATVYATEIDDAALEIARENAKLLQADIEFFKGNLVEPLAAQNLMPTVLLCNLPYVPDTYEINQAAKHEPAIALYGGEDGLDLYNELFDRISKISTKLQFIITESLPMQHIALANIALVHGYQLDHAQDFIQVFRAI